jgi:hypothetical protein
VICGGRASPPPICAIPLCVESSSRKASPRNHCFIYLTWGSNNCCAKLDDLKTQNINRNNWNKLVMTNSKEKHRCTAVGLGRRTINYATHPLQVLHSKEIWAPRQHHDVTNREKGTSVSTTQAKQQPIRLYIECVEADKSLFAAKQQDQYDMAYTVGKTLSNCCVLRSAADMLDTLLRKMRPSQRPDNETKPNAR